jgi:hypothetical protein
MMHTVGSPATDTKLFLNGVVVFVFLSSAPLTFIHFYLSHENLKKIKSCDNMTHLVSFPQD